MHGSLDLGLELKETEPQGGTGSSPASSPLPLLSIECTEEGAGYEIRRRKSVAEKLIHSQHLSLDDLKSVVVQSPISKNAKPDVAWKSNLTETNITQEKQALKELMKEMETDESEEVKEKIRFMHQYAWALLPFV
jgi:hypothetical protein